MKRGSMSQGVDIEHLSVKIPSVWDEGIDSTERNQQLRWKGLFFRATPFLASFIFFDLCLRLPRTVNDFLLAIHIATVVSNCLNREQV